MKISWINRRPAAEHRSMHGTGRSYGFGRKSSRACPSSGFTLLEVLVSLAVLSVGAALTLSLSSGSLGNIRKVQLRTRTIEHAEAVMELALLDPSILEPTNFTGDFQDGTRWAVDVQEYTPPDALLGLPMPQPNRLRVKLLSFTVTVIAPDSREPDYQLQTLKLVPTPQAQNRGLLQ